MWKIICQWWHLDLKFINRNSFLCVIVCYYESRWLNLWRPYEKSSEFSSNLTVAVPLKHFTFSSWDNKSFEIQNHHLKKKKTNLEKSLFTNLMKSLPVVSVKHRDDLFCSHTRENSGWSMQHDQRRADMCGFSFHLKCDFCELFQSPYCNSTYDGFPNR